MTYVCVLSPKVLTGTEERQHFGPHRRRDPDGRRPVDGDVEATNPHAEELSPKADELYSDVLRGLPRGYNGDRNAVGAAVRKMFGFENTAQELPRLARDEFE